MNKHPSAKEQNLSNLKVIGVENETRLVECTLQDQEGRPFTARVFYNAAGYERGGKQILCEERNPGIKNPEIATFRIELESIEPLGSLYVCKDHIPDKINLALVNE